MWLSQKGTRKRGNGDVCNRVYSYVVVFIIVLNFQRANITFISTNQFKNRYSRLYLFVLTKLITEEENGTLIFMHHQESDKYFSVFLNRA